MYELGLTKNKKWQDKLRNELKSNFGTTKGTFPNKESIKNLPITMAIWKETLRMHPISLGGLRETGKDIETLEKDMDRDNFMTPDEAVEYGLADEVVAKRVKK